MKVLIIGGGGREHALGWKLAQSSKVTRLYFCPGNPGTATVGENIGFGWEETEQLISFALKNKVDLAIVSMDDALAAGLTDKLQAIGVKTFGPDKFAAQIESSKSFAKTMMQRLNIPTAAFATFNSYTKAKAYVDTESYPIVIKASGLARGKGVVICRTKKQAMQTLHSIMVGKSFGKAGATVVIEEFLEGYELSVHALCDGKSAVLFPLSQDNKPIFDGDKGPNTGGMGATVPVDVLSEYDMRFVRERIVQPIIDEFRRLKHPFIGCLYPGLMVTRRGIKVIEYNARFGDPEAQGYMRLLRSDLVDVLLACTKGQLPDNYKLEWHSGAAICVVLASEGYPEKSVINRDITGIDKADNDNCVVFQAGTRRSQQKLITSGGRVLNITATGKDISEARKKAYLAVKKIKFDGMQYRKDIGVSKI
jgi:phosphoribosylamine--glycine ligase